MTDTQAPRTLRERQREQTRQHLLQTAAELIGQKGFNATSIDDIAKAAGAGRATVYSYFETKDAILDEIIQVMWDEAAELYTQLGALDAWTRPAIAAWTSRVVDAWEHDHRRNKAASEAGGPRLMKAASKYHRTYAQAMLGNHWEGRYDYDEAFLRATLVISLLESFMTKFFGYDLEIDAQAARRVLGDATCDLLLVS